MKDVILPYLQKILEAAEKGIEIAQQEIPLIVEEWIMYNAIYNWTLVAFSVLIGTITALSIRKVLRQEWVQEDKNMASIIIGVIGAGCSLTIFFTYVFDAIKITWFPRVWLLEQAMELIK